jgi:ATP/ADP translocase
MRQWRGFMPDKHLPRSEMVVVGFQGSLGTSLQILVATVVGVTGIMMATKAYVDRAIPRPEASEHKSKDKKGKKGKKKGSIGESFAVLRGSPMISNLALLVVGYGLTHRLFEFCWKGQLRLLYPSAQAYQVQAHPVLHGLGIDYGGAPCNYYSYFLMYGGAWW